jgi:gliding motility-associated-like protein
MIASGIMLFIFLSSSGQMTMPDYVISGQTRHYYVNPSPLSGSTYTWFIDGDEVQGNSTTEIEYIWDSSKVYMIEVQELSAEGCHGSRKSGLVYVNPPPDIRISVSDTMVCDGESVTISVANPSRLIWGKWLYDLVVEPGPGMMGNMLNGTYEGPAVLTETLSNNGVELQSVVYRFIPVIENSEGERVDEGEEEKVTVWVRSGSVCREDKLVIPNVFSPNGDGINDIWEISGTGWYPDLEVTVFNRWGQTVWRSGRGYPVPWDGRSRGKMLPVDSYHYVADKQDGSRPVVGTITIVR